jgi:hypothetical protein
VAGTTEFGKEVRWPAGQPAHPLEYWLSPELARVTPTEASSRLRQLADAQGTLAAAWSGAIAGGPVLALAGAFFSTVYGHPAAVLVLGPVGVALLVHGLIAWKRVRGRLPNTDKVLITRGPGRARGGLTLVAVLAAVTGAGMAATLPNAAANGTSVAVIGAYLLTVALMGACILAPATVMGQARQSFRRRLHTDPNLRKAVEEDLATWRDPYGNAGYGPL